MSLNEEICRLRHIHAFSQRTLAQIVGVISQYIGMIESGQRIPRGDILVLIGNALDWRPANYLPLYLQTSPNPRSLVDASHQLIQHSYFTAAREVLHRAWTVDRRDYNRRYRFRIGHALALLAAAQTRWGIALGWFRYLTRHLSRASAETTAKIHYDMGLTLAMIGRKVEAFSAFDRALNGLRTTRRQLLLRGYLGLAMENILLEFGHAAEAKQYYQLARQSLKNTLYYEEALFGVALCEQYLQPHAASLQSQFEHCQFDDQHANLVVRWQLAIAAGWP